MAINLDSLIQSAKNAIGLAIPTPQNISRDVQGLGQAIGSVFSPRPGVNPDQTFQQQPIPIMQTAQNVGNAVVNARNNIVAPIMNSQFGQQLQAATAREN